MEKAFAVGVYNMKAMKKISSAGIVAAMIIVFYVYASFSVSYTHLTLPDDNVRV